MIIELLKVKGIGPFKNEVELHPTELDEIIAITGRNGTGKTFFLECISGALYVYFPFRMHKQQGISVYDFVAENQESFIEMIFNVGDRRFRIIRNFSLNGTWEGTVFKETSKDQTAVIYEWENDTWEPKAEKVKNVLAFVESEVCSKQVFFSAMFNSQNSAGDLVTCTADERKQIFASIIGLGGLQDKSELFNQRTKDIGTLLEKINILISAEESNIGEDEFMKKQIDELNQKREAVKVKIEKLSEERDKLVVAKENQDATEKKIKSDLAKLDTLKKKQSELQTKYTGFVGEFRLADSIGIKIKELDDLTVQLDECQETAKGFTEKAAELSEKKNQIEKLRTTIVQAKSKIQGERSEVDKKIGEANNHIYTLKNQLKEWDRKSEGAAILDDLDCAADCKYVSGARTDKQWLDDNVMLRDNLQADVEEIEEHLKACNIEAQEIDARLNDKAYCPDERVEGIKLVRERSSLDLGLEGYDELLVKIRRITARIEVLEREKYPVRLAESQIAGERASETKVALDELVVDIEDIESLNPQLNKVEYDYLLEENEKEIARLREYMESSLQEIERNKADIKRSKTAALKITIYKNKHLRFAKIQVAYSKLSEAFSRSGIQALIIDSEKSTFLNIAQELFGILSGGRLELNFSTTKELKKDKSKKETFDLRLKVEGEERRLEQASQGQQDLARIVMRATLGIYFASKTGNCVESYFLDETTGSLDEYNREDYYEFLKHLLTHFKQIFVITHQDIAKQIPCHVHINENRELEIT